MRGIIITLKRRFKRPISSEESEMFILNLKSYLQSEEFKFRSDGSYKLEFDSNLSWNERHQNPLESGIFSIEQRDSNSYLTLKFPLTWQIFYIPIITAWAILQSILLWLGLMTFLGLIFILPQYIRTRNLFIIRFNLLNDSLDNDHLSTLSKSIEDASYLNYAKGFNKLIKYKSFLFYLTFLTLIITLICNILSVLGTNVLDNHPAFSLTTILLSIVIIPLAFRLYNGMVNHSRQMENQILSEERESLIKKSHFKILFILAIIYIPVSYVLAGTYLEPGQPGERDGIYYMGEKSIIYKYLTKEEYDFRIAMVYRFISSIFIFLYAGVCFKIFPFEKPLKVSYTKKLSV